MTFELDNLQSGHSFGFYAPTSNKSTS